MLAVAGAASVLLIGGGIAYAATTPGTATCTANPTITDGTSTQSIRVTCSWPKPAPVTSTVTSTVTVTASPEPTTTTTTTAPDPTTTTSVPATTTTTAAAPAPAPSTASGAFPNADNTGPTVALAPVPKSTSFGGWATDAFGNVDITAAGAVVDGYDIPGAIFNDRDVPFTLRNSWVRCIGENSWCVTMGSGGSLVEDSIIGGGDPAHPYNMAIGVLSYQGNGAQNRVLRTEIHHLMHGVRADGNFYIADSYLHDFPMGDPTYDYSRGTNRTDLHSDATMTQGAERVEAQHNTLWGGNTSAFFVQPDVGNTTSKVKTVVVNNNLFVSTTRNGQMPTWGVLIEAKPVNGVSRTLGPVTVTNNQFTRGNWEGGPMSIEVPATVSGNTYTDGTPIN